MPADHVLARIAARLGLPKSYLHAMPVGGGSIHQALCIEYQEKKWFLKYNEASQASNFAAEAAGLEALEATQTLACARVLDRFEDGNQAFLLLDWVEQGPRTPQFWEDFGRGLARLHRFSTEAFGWHHDNYIGRLPQYNAQLADFREFFWTQRIEPRLREAIQLNLLDSAHAKQMESICKQLYEWVPVEEPALLHGDLWSGNFLCSSEGKPILIDPAVHYGHRESELAFTRLFGGFSPKFYAAYEEEFPMQEGWESRIDLLNLYPLMVHLVLFGRAYLPDVLQILVRFG